MFDDTQQAARERECLLFISPVYPDTGGNGLAMRGALFIEALARRYQISLLVLPLFGDQTASSEAFLRAHEVEVIAIELRAPRGLRRRLQSAVGRDPALVRLAHAHASAGRYALAGRDFEVIHAFRLYTASLATDLAAVKQRAVRPALHLDMDDIESHTRTRIAAVYDLNGERAEAAAERREAKRFQAAERRVSARFDRVYVCSTADAARLDMPGVEVRVVPNAVRLSAPRARLTSHPFTFLFVGTLGYYPNEDAVRYFCTQVLPLIRASAAEPFRVRVVGPGMPPGLTTLGASDELRLVGQVDDLGREYGEADAVIVPLRAGGGTRIKVLEAFSYQRPVVSTSIGMEGIEAEPGHHLLVGDTPAAFAEQCLKLMADESLRAGLASRARILVADRYSQERMNALVSEWS